MTAPDFIPTHGEVSGFLRNRDWSTTSLGEPSTWPGGLRTVLRLMLASRYAMWMGWGPDLTFFYNDEYAKQSLGAKHPWAIGRPLAEVWAEIWEPIEQRVSHVLRTGEATYDTELMLFVERSGYLEETYHSFSYSPVPGDAAGETAGIFCVVVEETERVITERRMAVLRDLAAALAPVRAPDDVFPAALRSLAGALATKELPFAIVYPLGDDDASAEARPALQSGFGEAPAPDLAAWPLADVRRARAAITVPLAPEQAWPKGAWPGSPTSALVVPVPHQGRDGLAALLVVGVNPHRPLDEGMRGFVQLVAGQLAASFGNALAYHEQQARADALTALDRAKTAFFSNVSHELRTPLTLMLGPTEDALASPERVLRGSDLETVHRNELRLLKLVNALLDFARIEAGRTRASFEPTDLAQLTADLASAFRSAIERAGLAFEVDIEPMPGPIHVDHDLWEKIVLNLLSNAFKFTFEGAVKVRLRFRDEHAELTITDSGVGVAAAELPRLFERFHRVAGTRARTHEGSGIGLALVHDLVMMHGGTIAVHSDLGVGTSFTIRIPRGTAHLPADQVVTPGHERTSAAPTRTAFVEEAMRWGPGSTGAEDDRPVPSVATTTTRVLVADDNADMRDYLARILGQHFVVETVADGLAALESVRRELPEVLVADVMMPGLDGFELVRRLRADVATAALPIILLSARAGEEATADGLRSGADDYVAKPFSAGALLVRVEAQISAARLRRTLLETAENERQRLQSLFEVSPAAIAILRGDELRIELVNPMMSVIWGPTDKLLGRPLLDAVPVLRGQGFDAMLREVIATGVAVQGREVLARLDPGRTGNPAEHYFDFVYAALRGPGGEGAVLVHAFDVTDKVRTRHQAERLREVAERANRVKDEFLATMSHELRTPLNAMLGWSTLLRGEIGRDWSRIERGLEIIERNARSQARLIDDVLDVSRIISGKLRLDMAAVDLVTVAKAAVEVVRPAAEARDLDLVIDAPDEGTIDLVGDADRLQQIVWNLLSNAVKFTEPGGSILLCIDRVGTHAELVVRDTGAGIPAGHLAEVFERFRQVDNSTTRRHGGLGLGLAIVRHLVELHGGTVVAESEGEGRGATFRVRLPTRITRSRPAIAPATHGGNTPAPRRTIDGTLREVRVLVVDDDDDSRQLVESALVIAGATVQSAESASAGFARLLAGPVDVLVSDIGMPDEDGYAFLERVRGLPAEQGGQIAAIALTAYASSADIERAERAGFQRHVAKPADLDAIVAAVLAVAPKRH